MAGIKRNNPAPNKLNVVIIDGLNKVVIKSNKIIYFKNKEKLITEGKTKITVEDNANGQIHIHYGNIRLDIWRQEYNVFYNELTKITNRITINFLIEKKVQSVWNNIRKNSKNKKQFLLFFHQWFDALMIIQLLKKLNN